MDMPKEEGGKVLEVSDAAIEQLQVAVKDLYSFRDLFFESHAIEEASKKNDLLKEKLDNTLLLFTQLKGQADKSDKSMYLYLLGRALNVMPDANAEAEESLSKALKLNPSLIDAWNVLGECFWKRGKTRDAKNCFENALSHKRNKESLRSLSITTRDEALRSKSMEERQKLTIHGVALAKEAVNLDFQDGTSWAILANAHLSEFFNVAQNPLYLKSALKAYNLAEKDPVTKSTSEFHFNKASALKYDENYELALDALNQACSLDPNWETPAQKLDDLINYLSQINDLVQKKGKLGIKKLQGMIKTLTPNLLGPYCGSFRGLTLSLIPLSEMMTGTNLEKVVLGRVVCHIRSDEGVPFTFCITDKDLTTVAVTVYNLAGGKGFIIGDSVAIPEPFCTKVNISFKGKEYSFNSIRVNTPMLLVVNGRRVGKDAEAGVQLSTFN